MKKRKKERNRPFPPAALIISFVRRSTGFSCLQPPCLVSFLLLRCTSLYPVLLFAFAINLLFDTSSYIIKLSYPAREFASAVKPSIRSFICLNVFQHYFLLAFTFLPSLSPPPSLFLSVLLVFLPPRALSPPVSFLLLLVFFFF